MYSKAFLLILSINIFIVSFAQKQVAVINGSLENIGDTISYVYYSYQRQEGNSIIEDSSRVINKKYTFRIEEEMPLLISIRSRPFNDRSISRRTIEKDIFIQAGKNILKSKNIFINITTPQLYANEEYVKLQNLLAPTSSKIGQLSEKQRMLIENKDSMGLYELQKELDIARFNYRNVNMEYVRNNPSSPIALFALKKYAGNLFDYEKVDPLFKLLNTNIKKSYEGREFEKEISIAKKFSTGALAPVFSLPDTLGNFITLEEFRGKYVLLDFWASWCTPCRLKHPHLKKLYSELKNKNFTIISISLDEQKNRGKWIEAIKADDLTWINVSDLKGFDNGISTLYNVKEIPQNFLIDPNGKIIGKYLEIDAIKKLIQ